jgi:hypothetical protein
VGAPTGEEFVRFALAVLLTRTVLRRRYSPIVQFDRSEVEGVQERQSL